MVEHQASRFVEHAIGLACLLGADRELDSSITSKRIVSHLLFHFNLSHNDKEMLQAPNCSDQRDDEDMKLSLTLETRDTRETKQATSNEQQEPIDEGTKNSTSLPQPTTPSLTRSTLDID